MKICIVEGCNTERIWKQEYCERHYYQIRRCGCIHETYFDRLNMTCKVDDCQVKAKTMGYCNRHYSQIQRLGKTIETSFDRGNICNVSGCNGKVKAKGLCVKHYHHLQRHGQILSRTRHDSNEFIIKDDIAYIQLYDKDCNPTKQAVIDKEDVSRCKEHKWHLNSHGYVATHVGQTAILLHLFILNRKGSHKIQTDHKNQIKHDCRKSNLRLCTPNQNKYNACLISTNTSGFKGVHFCKQTQKWVASIIADKQFYSLGYFTEKDEAAKARDEAAKKLHGEFAVFSLLGEV